KARVAAEKAKYAVPIDPQASTLALAASQAERQAAVLRAELELMQAELQGETKVKAAAEKLTTARDALEKTDGQYSPLGEMYPRTSTGRRLALARWIASPTNPRTARVAVNHVWLRHFGQALVPTVANLGVNGKPPSHPELLDWLASELVASGWSMKHLHRLMVPSSTYRMPSSPGADNASADPENHFLWRMNSRRMEAEVVRDSLLFLAGRLDLTPGGPELDENRSHEILRRSMYFRNTPNEKVAFLDLFDLANPNQCYERQVSVVPQQALALTNSPLALDQARLLGQQLSAEGDDGFITTAFERILSRRPTEVERLACGRFLGQQTALLGEPGKLTTFPPGSQGKVPPATDPHRRARENLIQVLFEHNDFVTIR